MSDDDAIDDVGYRKPPVQYRFRKGQSGNPRGRPKGRGDLVQAFKQIACKKVTVHEANRMRRITIAEAVVSKQWQLAINGDQTAIYNLLPLLEEAAVVASGPDPHAHLFTPEGDLVDWLKPGWEQLQDLLARRTELRSEWRRRRRLRAERQHETKHGFRERKPRIRPKGSPGKNDRRQ